jgi:hypothetical protein
MVVLSACNSGNSGTLGNQLGSVAQALHRAGIAAVLASRYPLSISGSIRLCKSLYSALLVSQKTLERALLGVRQALAEDPEQLDWASLQLYARAEDGHETRPIHFQPVSGTSFNPGPPPSRPVTQVTAELKSIQAQAEPMNPGAPKGPSASGAASGPTSGHLLRRALFETLRTDADFDAFCLDNFRDTYRLFSSGMDRQQKITLLLSREDPEQVWTRLRAESR